MTMPVVVIIILNWNNAPDTLATVVSARSLAYPAAELLVVDNGSTDDSVFAIRSAFPDVEVIETGANLGYAGGNNAGLKLALARGAEYALILNNDVTIAPDALSVLVDGLVQDPDACVATPSVVYAERPQAIWALGSAVDWRTAAVTRLNDGDRLAQHIDTLPYQVDIASGAAMLVRLDTIRRFGSMDEQFFLYYEETDWCLQIAKHGCRILAVPGAVVAHKVSATLGVSSPVVDYYMLRNHLRLVMRNWHGMRRAAILVRLAARNLLTMLAYTVKSRGGSRTPHRDARLLALRDAILRHWGPMGPDVQAACQGRPS